MKKLLFVITVACLYVLNANAGGIKTSYRNALILAYSQANSVYEDDNIKLEIYDEQLWAINKTSKTIFIDLAQCFVFHNGRSMPLAGGEEKKSKKNDEKKASKSGVSTKDDLYITLAPVMGNKQNDTYICNMSMSIYREYTTTEAKNDDFTDYDLRLLNTVNELITESKNADPKSSEYKGTAVRHMTEDESINNIGASVAYAFNKNTENWTTISISTWVSDVIFAPIFIEMPKDLKKKEMRGFGVKETEPAVVHIKANSPFEFDEDKSPIIVCDWTGNFKKGKFWLNPTWIVKTKKLNAFHIVGAFFTAGVTLLSPLRQEAYKNILRFDGEEADWGKLSYANSLEDTKQSK
ncbi:hypothetical protein [Xylanibacter ruminicola]|uniref:DUF4412 domain-containing protein n=1 Tax=Xylanibacter ruminicola TaxID=839 RepID=A0A1M6TIK1_XYLRU|nr:hypothetical protein [Xylanibacter ruminicola]SHK56739.1 hypothetical protein SAMN05216463_10632 [Xylanibacter ruminicola]